MTQMDAALAELTVVIPTYNRPAQAQRALRFWSRTEARVIMLDGSDDPLGTKVTGALPARIRYLHLPISMAERFVHVLNLIETPCVCLCGDDEFYLPSGLAAALEFLQSHPDHVCCAGQALGFDVTETGSMRGVEQYRALDGLSLEMPTGRARAIHHMRAYVPATLYSVVRREAWLAGIRLWAEREFPVYAIGEIQFEFAVAYAGQVRMLPHLHWLRSREQRKGTHQTRKGADASLTARLLFPAFWTGAAHAQMRAEFIAQTAQSLSDSLGYDPDQVAHDLVAAMDAYVIFAQEGAPRPSGILSRLRARIAKKRGKVPRPMASRLAEMEARGITVNHADMAQISQSVAQSRLG